MASANSPKGGDLLFAGPWQTKTNGSGYALSILSRWYKVWIPAYLEVQDTY